MLQIRRSGAGAPREVDAVRPDSKVAIFGGSFNPPHVGHVLAVVYALSTAPIDEVVVVPCYQHPFAKDLTPYDDRFRMCQMAFGHLPHVSVSRIEEALGGESKTLRTVEALAAQDPSSTFRLMVGSDVLGDVARWHRWDRIVELAPPLDLRRGGTRGSLLPDVSSTAVRTAIRAGDWPEVERLLPKEVAAHVRRAGLYAA